MFPVRDERGGKSLNSPNENTLNSHNNINQEFLFCVTGKYYPRIVDAEIQEKLGLFGAVVVVGPKWCGKTTSAERCSKSTLFLQDPAKVDLYKILAKTNPSKLLEGKKPRLIDEWQEEPGLWDAVRFAIDRGSGPGSFILTGSVTPAKESVRHTGTGRIVKVAMRTLSLYESGDSTGDVSLSTLFDGIQSVSGASALDYPAVSEILVRGGWPESIGRNVKDAHGIVAGYCESILDSDINLPGGRKRNKQWMRQILRSLSRHTAAGAPNTTVHADVTSESEGGMSINTVSDYISALKDIYVVEDLEAWSPKLRSKIAIRTSDVRHMSDPAIAAYFLNAGAKDLEADPNTFGLLFESLVVRDLRVYSQKLAGSVFHYRDSEGLEVDAIVHLNDRRWGAIEVKLGTFAADAGAKNLLRLSKRVDTESMNPPSFLAVVTATGYAYTREDGVHVIPIGCLRD